MQTISDLIDAARSRTGANYTDISDRLDRSKQLITNWRSGKKVPTDGDVLALARMAGENADKWLAIAQAARVDGEARKRWEGIARRLAATATLLAVAVLGAAQVTAPAGLISQNPPGLHIMYRATRRFGLLRAWLAQFLPRRRPSNSIEARICL